MHDQILDDLHAILEEEVRQAEVTADKLAAKKQALVENRPETLAAIDRELTGIVQKSRQLAQQRATLMQELDAPQLKLDDLIPRMKPTQASRFRNSRQRLLIAARTVERLNLEARDLLNLSLKWVHDTVEVIAASLTPEGAAYTAQGNKSAKKTGSENLSTQSTVNHSA